MSGWGKYIESLRAEWIWKNVIYEGQKHTIVEVDYNGILHIDRPTEHTLTTAVFMPHEVKKALI